MPPKVASLVSIAGTSPRDGDGLGLLAGLHHQIYTNGLAHLHQHAAVLHSAEALGLGANRIRAWGQVGSHVFPGTIRDQGSSDASRHVDHRHRRAGNGAAALVKQRSLNGALIGL